MAEGTRHAQLIEAVAALKVESTQMRDEQNKQKLLLEGIFQQLNNLASSYEHLVVNAVKQNSEGNSSESSPVNTWEELVGALKIRFGPIAYEDPIGVFTKLRQANFVEEYQSQFEILSNKIKGITEEFRVSTFISGLRDDLKIPVAMFKPTTLSATFGLARLQEEEVERRSQGYQPKYQNPQPFNQYQHPKLPTTPPILRLPAPPPRPEFKNQNTTVRPPPTMAKKPNFPIKRITPTQMQKRRENKLCYYCDEKYYPGHKCSRPRIFLIEGIGIEEEESEEVEKEKGVLTVIQSEEFEREKVGELLRTSLHAIAGSVAPKTMRLFVEINHQKVLVLIDTGSTHSFIDP
ncbi:hypothetical protein F0562_032355 [Nyssa sinensis]|uniref:Retrotransposon gag domain-containing protein n=1 Tax=Nyssa sinensis TaxID=561372 RepID=A0A5J5ARF8_9ASTE|nr:hypothetical protein F0562_032355 [Nyssa sinensis]